MPSLSSLPSFYQPYLTLTFSFIAWKSLLLCLVLLSPGPGYDTSTTLLPALPPSYGSANDPSLFGYLRQRLVERLVRWDAIYFTQIARRGYVYEQEWAFGWLHTRVLAFLSGFLVARDQVPSTEVVALVGIVVSHACHLASVFVLYALTLDVWGRGEEEEEVKRFALLSGILHVLSPAGVFLSGVYAEGLFALGHFVGCWCFVRGKRACFDGSEGCGAVFSLLAGVVWGLVAMVRGNGILTGLIFVCEAVGHGWALMQSFRNGSAARISSAQKNLVRLVTDLFSGFLMGVLAGYPQYLAYDQYCLRAAKEDRRPWCSSYIPSIYAFVQKEYW